MATHPSVPAWRIPGTGEPGGLPSMGSHRVGHDWSDLAAASFLLQYFQYKLLSFPFCHYSPKTPNFLTVFLDTLLDTLPPPSRWYSLLLLKWLSEFLGWWYYFSPCLSKDQESKPLIQSPHSMNSPELLRVLLFLLRSPSVATNFSQKNLGDAFFFFFLGDAFFKKYHLFIYGCAGSSLLHHLLSSGKRGLLLIAVRGLLSGVASLVAEHRL